MYQRYLFSLFITCSTVLFLSGCAENPAEKTNPAEITTPFEASSTTAEGTTYTFDDRTTVEFTGSKITGSHEGGFKEVSGSVIVPEGDLAQAQINVTINMNSLWSDNEKLTGHLKTADFFDVATFPEATFISTSLTESSTGYLVNGNLTLHGVTKGITFPATLSISEGAQPVLQSSAEFSIIRTDFGINYKGKADDLIRPEVVLRFNLEAAILP